MEYPNSKILNDISDDTIEAVKDLLMNLLANVDDSVQNVESVDMIENSETDIETPTDYDTENSPLLQLLPKEDLERLIDQLPEFGDDLPIRMRHLDFNGSGSSSSSSEEGDEYLSACNSEDLRDHDDLNLYQLDFLEQMVRHLRGTDLRANNNNLRSADYPESDDEEEENEDEKEQNEDEKDENKDEEEEDENEDEEEEDEKEENEDEE